MGLNKMSNGDHQHSEPLRRGVYVPTVAFFTPEDEIDIETTEAHAIKLLEAGVTGLLVHGSNGEAVHLDHEERKTIVKATKSALVKCGKGDQFLIVGCGAQSTRETIQLCHEAAEAGGTHAMILPPSYFGSLLTTDLIVEHFRSVADASPIPLLVYNFPAPTGGLDLSSETILTMAEHPNIVGTKLTCGNTGKLARIVAGTRNTSFRTFGGSADFTVQALAVDGHGVIAGLANLAPRTCVKLMRLWDEGQLAEATQLQGLVARGDWAAIKGGFVSVKAALQRYYGYGGLPRRPCALLKGKALDAQMADFSELIELEKELAASRS